MLQKHTVSPELLKVLERLMIIEDLKEFRLVGGTALALYLGHRISTTIDLFTDNPSINMLALKENLEQQLHFSNARPLGDINEGFTFDVDSIKLTIKKSINKFIGHAQTVKGIRLATLNDLGVFKLVAIQCRDEKKDFIDLYFIFQRTPPMWVLEKYIKAAPQRVRLSVLLALRKIEHVSKSPTSMPVMLVRFCWEKAIRVINDCSFGGLNLFGFLSSLRTYLTGDFKEFQAVCEKKKDEKLKDGKSDLIQGVVSVAPTSSVGEQNAGNRYIYKPEIIHYHDLSIPIALSLFAVIDILGFFLRDDEEDGEKSDITKTRQNFDKFFENNTINKMAIASGFDFPKDQLYFRDENNRLALSVSALNEIVMKRFDEIRNELNKFERYKNTKKQFEKYITNGETKSNKLADKIERVISRLTV